MENIDKELKSTGELKSNIRKAFEDKEFQAMWMRMHTPWIRKHKKIGRNEVCPFCNSGLKYKQCKCYTHRKEYELDVKHTKGWR